MLWVGVHLRYHAATTEAEIICLRKSEDQYLLLHYPLHCLHSTPSQKALSYQTLPLKSPRMMALMEEFDQTAPSREGYCVNMGAEYVCSGNSRDNVFKVFTELVFCLICVGHNGCIGADDGSELFPVMKWKSHSNVAVIHPFRGGWLTYLRVKSWWHSPLRLCVHHRMHIHSRKMNCLNFSHSALPCLPAWSHWGQQCLFFTWQIQKR